MFLKHQKPIGLKTDRREVRRVADQSDVLRERGANFQGNGHREAKKERIFQALRSSGGRVENRKDFVRDEGVRSRSGMKKRAIHDSESSIIGSVALPAIEPWETVWSRNLVITAGLLLFLCIPSGCTLPDQTSSSSVFPPEKTGKPLSAPPALQPESAPEEMAPPAQTSTEPSAEILARGVALYQEHCASCHGVNGDGNGELAAYLEPRPANLTTGVYKFRSTPSGALPTDDDLFRTLSVGVPGTGMPDFQDLTVSEREVLVSHLKTLSPRFAEELHASPIPVPAARIATDQALARGRQVFSDMRCAACHGEEGRGDGPLAEELSDSEGMPIRPADLTKRPFKSGKNPESIYRTIMTGLDGTPMPSYGDSLDPEEAWDLALYVASLAEPKGEP